MSNVVSLSQRFSNLIIGLHFSVAMFFYDVVASRADDNDVAVRELFLRTELPFESGKSPVYELVMITQILHQMSTAIVVTLESKEF